MHNTSCDILFKSFRDVIEESLVDKKDSVWKTLPEKKTILKNKAVLMHICK